MANVASIRETRGLSIHELRLLCQPNPPSNQSWFPRFFARPVSIYLTKMILYTPFSANQVTILMLLVGLASGALFIFNNYWMSLAGGILAVFGLVLDCTDGEVSRCKKQSSLLGTFLDRFTHMLVYPFMFVGITFGSYAETHDIRIFIFGFLAAIFVLLRFILRLERTAILSRAGKDSDDVSIVSSISDTSGIQGNWISRLLKKLSGKIPDVAYDIYLTMIAFLLGAIFDRLDIVLIVYGIMLPLRWLLQAFFEVKYYL
jgi:hypothetical protein